MRGYLVRFARRIGLIDPPKLSENEIRQGPYNAGYEAEVSEENPYARGSVNYRSWDQGKRARDQYEQTLW